jgi:uncharacterized RDD family membrane protein YckC
LVSWYELALERPEDILQVRRGEILMLALWLAFLYFTVFHWRFNGTLGKRFLGLRVVAGERSKIGFARSFIRSSSRFPCPLSAPYC